jgi:cell division inhibitor SepF
VRNEENRVQTTQLGVWKRALVYLGLVDEDELEETDEVASFDEPPAENPVSIRKLSREELHSVQPLQAKRALGQVHIVEPRAYDDAQEIGDKLKEEVPVIMNLQGVEEDLFKRMTAFASGLAYGINGRVQRLAPKVYLITPENVEVSAEDRRRLAERGLFSEF